MEYKVSTSWFMYSSEMNTAAVTIGKTHSTITLFALQHSVKNM